MLFRVFLERFNAALIAFLILAPTFFPFHTSTRRIYLSRGLYSTLAADLSPEFFNRVFD